MIRVQLIKNWTDYWMSDSEFLAQTPGGKGIWGGVHFFVEPISKPDYVVVLNRPKRDMVVRCDPQNVWGIIQEPPNELYRSMHKGQSAFARVLMADPGNRGARYQLSHPAVPWFLNVNYETLAAAKPVEKKARICCITSSTILFDGHERRLRFLAALRKELDIDVFGKGIRYVPSKWEVLSAYKYALVLENFIHPWYWSEKISDCFLAWTLPVYLGCPRINDYFPENSFVSINNLDAHAAVQCIRNMIRNQEWEQRLAGIEEARNLALNTYNVFSYIANLIEEHRRTTAPKPARDIRLRSVTIPLLIAWGRAKSRAWCINSGISSMSKRAVGAGEEPLFRGLNGSL